MWADFFDDGLDLVGDDFGGCFSSGFIVVDWGRDLDLDICGVGRGDLDVGLEFGLVNFFFCLEVLFIGLLMLLWEVVLGRLLFGEGDLWGVWLEDLVMIGRNWYLLVDRGNDVKFILEEERVFNNMYRYKRNYINIK